MKLRWLSLALLVVCPPAFAASSKDARTRFEAAVAQREQDLKSLQGRIRVENENLRTGAKDFLQGSFWVRRPDKMAVVYEAPSAQTVVCDGKTTWFYQPDVNQVTISKGGARPVFVDFQAGFKGLLTRGQVAKVEEAGEGFRVLVKRSGEKFWVTVDGKTLLPTQVESRVDEVRTRVLFSKIELGAEIPDARFQFKVPQGAEVMELPQEEDR